MESLLFGAYCHRVGVPAASVSTTLLNRLNGDQVFLSSYLYLFIFSVAPHADLFLIFFLGYKHPRTARTMVFECSRSGHCLHLQNFGKRREEPPHQTLNEFLKKKKKKVLF